MHATDKDVYATGTQCKALSEINLTSVDINVIVCRSQSHILYISHGSVSVFYVGVGFRFFGRFFKKSVRFSVSVF